MVCLLHLQVLAVIAVYSFKKCTWSLVLAGNAHVCASIVSSGYMSVGGGSARASEALLLRIPAALLPGDVGGGDRRSRISGHRQDLGLVLPNL